jgi:hypothetical protein
MPVADFMCDCGYEEDTVIFKVDQYPPCPQCGETLRRDHRYGINIGIKGTGYGSFTPIDMGVLGMCDTKEKYDRACSVIQERYPGAEINVTRESDTQKLTRLEEHKHKVEVGRRQKGIDKQALKKVHAEISKAQSMGAKGDELLTKGTNELISPSNNSTLQRPAKLAGKSRALA